MTELVKRQSVEMSVMGSEFPGPIRLENDNNPEDCANNASDYWRLSINNDSDYERA